MPEPEPSGARRTLNRLLIALALFTVGMVLGFGLCAQSAGTPPYNSPWGGFGVFLFFGSAIGFGITLLGIAVTALIMCFRK